MKSYQHVDKELGVMMTFGALVIEYGGWSWRPAIEGAKRTAYKCAKLGGMWMEKDAFSELHRFLVIKKQFQHIFAEKWMEYEQEQSDMVKIAQSVSNKDDDEAGNKSEEGAAKGVKTSNAPKRKAKADPADTTSKKTPKAESAKKETNPEADDMMKKALQTKQQLVKYRNMAEAMIKSIQTAAACGSKELRWANNRENLGELEESLTGLNNSVTPFAHDFMLLPIKKVLDKYGKEFNAELNSFNSLTVKIADLQKVLSRLSRQRSKE
jgi:hypothetical protein